MENSDYSRSIRNVLFAFLFILIVYLLKVLGSILIPLFMALFIAMLLQPILAWFERRKWPFSLSLGVISVGALSLIFLTGLVFFQTAESFAAEKGDLLQQVNNRLNSIVDWSKTSFDYEIDIVEIEKSINEYIASDWIVNSSGSFAGSLGSFFGAFFMTSLYLIAILGGILKYENFLKYLGKTDKQDQQYIDIFERVMRSISGYMKIKFLISLGTGILFWLVCFSFGVKFALFWGFLAFILNFIPTFGSIMATIPPVLLSLIEIDHSGQMIAFIVILFGIQTVMGNIVEPRLMGARLALNTVAVIFGLVFWGYLWGIAGMLLSVPLLVLLKVIFSTMPDADLFERLLSGSARSEE